jgi:hypothetical protein
MIEYFSGFDEEPTPEPEQPPEPAKANRVQNANLAHDMAAIMPLIERQIEATVEAKPPTKGFVYNKFTYMNPLRPTFMRYVQLQQAGFGVHLTQHSSDSPDLGQYRQADIFVDTDDSKAVMELMQATSETVTPHLRHARFIDMIDWGQLNPVYITGDATVDHEVCVQAWRAALPESVRSVKDEAGAVQVDFDEDKASTWYRRGFMTQVLIDHVDSALAGADMGAFAQEYSYVKEQWELYDRLREKGEMPFGFEELHGMIAVQFKQLFERFPAPSSKEELSE